LGGGRVVTVGRKKKARAAKKSKKKTGGKSAPTGEMNHVLGASRQRKKERGGRVNGGSREKDQILAQKKSGGLLPTTWQAALWKKNFRIECSSEEKKKGWIQKKGVRSGATKLSPDKTGSEECSGKRGVTADQDAAPTKKKKKKKKKKTYWKEKPNGGAAQTRMGVKGGKLPPGMKKEDLQGV